MKESQATLKRSGRKDARLAPAGRPFCGRHIMVLLVLIGRRCRQAHFGPNVDIGWDERADAASVNEPRKAPAQAEAKVPDSGVTALSLFLS